MRTPDRFGPAFSPITTWQETFTDVQTSCPCDDTHVPYEDRVRHKELKKSYFHLF